MKPSYTAQINIKVDPSLKAALDNLLTLSPRNEFPTMGDLLRDILDKAVATRLKKLMPKEEPECACIEVHTCGRAQ
jgi:hypothetical protein